MENLVKKAKILCKKIHNDNFYTINDNKLPYYKHCFIVAEIIEKNCEKDIDLNFALILAYLHDSIEDTSITHDYLCEKFNKPIADGVMALSKNISIPKNKQIFDSIQRILKQPKEVAIVKMADRICNLLSLPQNWNYEKCLNYLNDAKLIYNYLNKFSKNISKLLLQSINNYKIFILIKFKKRKNNIKNTK